MRSVVAPLVRLSTSTHTAGSTSMAIRRGLASESLTIVPPAPRHRARLIDRIIPPAQRTPEGYVGRHVDERQPVDGRSRVA